MNKIKISPSILAADMSCLGDEIARAVEGGCDDIHVDIMDGHFVPNLSFGPGIVKTLRKLTDLPLDVHLMMDNPLDMIESFSDSGSNYLTIHVEVSDDVHHILEKISDCGVHPGISLRPDTPVETIFPYLDTVDIVLRPDTPVETIFPYLDTVDIVLVMSVFPGFGGQTFIKESYERIEKIAKASSSMESPPLISVDGGVVIDNAPLLVKAGANHLVIGTALFGNHNAVENIRRMREAIKNI
jgi:ribulose-phosphate 3-epimerase